MEFLHGLDPLLKSLWYIAIPVSLIFVVQSLLTFMGADTHDGLSADFDSDLNGQETPFQLFSLRNLINFLLGFSWSGISLYSVIDNKVLLIFAAIIIGAGFVALFFLLMRQINRFAEDNSFRIENTVGKTGSVYLGIPGHKSGKGKVQISVNGTFHELEAFTEQERIETGSLVKVLRTEGNQLVVEKI
jgi:membrane protein implicated in regulation of membrane protease activity